MKPRHGLLGLILILLVGGGGYILYLKFAFTEEMARNTAKKFFNILMINGASKEFGEVYPSFGSGSRIVTPILCRINSVSKRDDGSYDVYASYDASKQKVYPISLIINHKGKIVNSRGVSYAHYDKTLEYGKKMGYLTGGEQDVELEQIISQYDLRNMLNREADLAIASIYTNLKTGGQISNQGFGFMSGTVYVTNSSPYDLEYNEIDCKINFYSSNGRLMDSEKFLMINLRAYSTETHSVFKSGRFAKYRIIPTIHISNALKNRVKDQLIEQMGL